MKLISLLTEDGLDIDIYDNTYDYGVAFVMDNCKPQDNYDLYLEHLAKHLDIIDSKGNPVTNAIVDLNNYVQNNIQAYFNIFENKSIENNIRNIIFLVSGNAPESLYKRLLENLGEKTIDIPEESEVEAI